MPPLIYEDLVIIGPAGNEAIVKGWVGAFRLDTGEPVWRFDTFAGGTEARSETWSATDAITSGAAVWTPLSLDSKEGQLYIPAGNPAPLRCRQTRGVPRCPSRDATPFCWGSIRS